ncbi:hypothetical protein [Buchananella hordeovulneris]|uniref:PQ-loop repeat-containing protein n=1 Tax=Buchananella hordeovulneris TaxID=52770 RepID=A0A1Q5PTZ9_9ACTO|nr:hypothetical protein [Buchananella hordeovulneris]OKL50949.1 hypothetical protein BSZ40_09960 [Buchananella hordeovulneris]RRD44155.1 hypothetical protein EII13_05470 [Buchananella hordeovulneris]
MSYVEIWGWVCAIVGSLTLVPQIARIVRTSTSAGVSLKSWQLSAGSFLAWTGHGVLGAYWNIIIANALLAACALAILLLIQRDRHLATGRVYWLALALAGALVAVRIQFGPLVYGLVAVGPQAVAMLAQLRSLLREHDITGVSGGFLAVNAAVQACWNAWAWLAWDLGVAGASTVMLAVCLPVLVVYLARRRGWRPATLVPTSPRPWQEKGAGS